MEEEEREEEDEEEEEEEKRENRRRRKRRKNNKRGIKNSVPCTSFNCTCSTVIMRTEKKLDSG